MEIHWSGGTRYHDWRGDREIPRRMLSRARAARVIGRVGWYSEGPDDERRKVAEDDGVLERLLDRAGNPRESLRFAAGGDDPHPWRMTLLLAHFIPDRGEVAGYNMLGLWFDAGSFSGIPGSHSLVRAFREIHTPADTEFAFIHPHPRWAQLSDAIAGDYGDPLTIAPMFAGVYWVNFLGARHLAYFDTDRLRQLRAYDVEWMDDEGLFLRVSAAVADATSPRVEAEMLRLTEEFRSAHR